MKNDNSHLLFLDSLRGIAAIIVVIGHNHGAFKSNNIFSNVIDFILRNTCLNGGFAVTLFFLLSGFVLSYNYFKDYNNEFILKQSIKRIPRLYLPVILTSIMYWIAIKNNILLNEEVISVNNSAFFQKFWNAEYGFFDFLLKCSYDLFILNDQEFCWNINSSLWTMPLELKFSFIVFFSIFFIKKTQHLIIVNIISLSTIFFFEGSLIDYFPFLLGINVSFFFIINQKKIPNYLLFILFLVGISLSFPQLYVIKSPISLKSIGAALIILVTLYSSSFQNFLKKRFLIYLGKISFGVYLIHNLILGTISSFFFISFSNILNTELLYILTLIVSIVFSIISGHIVYSSIDKYSIKIANYLYLFIKNIFNYTLKNEK